MDANLFRMPVPGKRNATRARPLPSHSFVADEYCLARYSLAKTTTRRPRYSDTITLGRRSTNSGCWLA
jgi:hypothetical protein